MAVGKEVARIGRGRLTAIFMAKFQGTSPPDLVGGAPATLALPPAGGTPGGTPGGTQVPPPGPAVRACRNTLPWGGTDGIGPDTFTAIRPGDPERGLNAEANTGASSWCSTGQSAAENRGSPSRPGSISMPKPGPEGAEPKPPALLGW